MISRINCPVWCLVYLVNWSFYIILVVFSLSGLPLWLSVSWTCTPQRSLALLFFCTFLIIVSTNIVLYAVGADHGYNSTPLCVQLVCPNDGVLQRAITCCMSVMTRYCVCRLYNTGYTGYNYSSQHIKHYLSVVTVVLIWTVCFSFLK